MNGVLIVDDDDIYRDFLVRELSKNRGLVRGVSSGEDAIETITASPQAFRFAVIDQDLGNDKMDGIETMRELVRVCPGLYPVVFSNIRKDARYREYKFKALESGAYRYIVRHENSENSTLQISAFVEEMERLERLRNWIASFHVARTAAPSLLTQLDVGMNIIDCHHKVWYMNDAMRRIAGYEEPGLPMSPCVKTNGFKSDPCVCCPVNKTFKDNKPSSGVLLCSLRRKNGLVFLKIWAQLVSDPPSGGIVGHPEPLAVMESVLDLTGTPELKAMPLDERLSLIANALMFIRKEAYSFDHLFDFVRIYIVDMSGSGLFVLKAASGERQPGQIGQLVDLRAVDGKKLGEAEGHMKSSGFGYWFEHVAGFDPAMPGHPRVPFIYWPIMQDDSTVAIIEAGGRLVKQDTAAEIRPYAAEVLKSIKDNRDRTTESIANASAASSVGEIDLLLHTEILPAEDQLKEIVRQACELTGSHQYILRYRDGENAALLRLGVPGFCSYEDCASSGYYPISYAESWSCRTILAGTETLANLAEQGDLILAFREKLDGRTKKVLQEANALCYEPLILEGFCIGSLGFHARGVANYDAEKRAILRLLAKRATKALHDYLMTRVIGERIEANAQAEIMGIVLHNVKTPLTSIQIAFRRLLEAYEDKCQRTPEMEALVRTIRGELSKIARLQQAVVKLRKPWESRVETVKLHSVICKVVSRRLAASEQICISYSLQDRIQDVQIDTAAVETCLEILVDNAVDALKDVPVKNLQIIMRDVEMAEGVNTGSLSKLAIDVVDNGSGVPIEMVGRLFKAMQTGKLSGTGLGLLHCHRIARSARGDVIHDSTYTPGAKFTLLLPYSKGGV